MIIAIKEIKMIKKKAPTGRPRSIEEMGYRCEFCGSKEGVKAVGGKKLLCQDCREGRGLPKAV